ncbi:MAG: HepT-like ribonuclease domain-containing protein [Nitrospirota bacterium]
MQKEFKVRLIKHVTFLENELKDYDAFSSLSWEQYNTDRDKRRNVERWIENIINSSIDIAKIILTSEGLALPDTYKEIVNSVSLVADFNKEKMETLSRWVRLRNIISHEYLDIRWSSIKRFISESRPLFEDFLAATKGYIERKERKDSAETA